MTTADASPHAVAGGMRPRKRERTRRAISDAAFRLFAERGFDAVRLTEIAQAADVAPATVFTHFSSKEDIFFSRRDDFNAGLPTAVADAATGADLLARLREYLDSSGELTLAEEWLDTSRTFSRVLLASEALRRSYLAVLQQREDLLADLLRERAADHGDPAELALLAAFTAAVRAHAFTVLHAGLAAGDPADRIRTRFQAALERGFARLTAAYAGDPVLERGAAKGVRPDAVGDVR